MSNQIVPSIYSAVIFDVVNRIRQSGGEIDVDDGVLEDLQRTWLQKMILSKVFEFPSEPVEGDGNCEYGVMYETGIDINTALPLELAEQVAQQQSYNSSIQNHLQRSFNNYTVEPQKHPHDTPDTSSNNPFDSSYSQDVSQFSSGSQPPNHKHRMDAPDPQATEQVKKTAKKSKKSNDSGSDLDNSIDSELDDDDSESELKSIKHLVLCQYERVRRTKNKWRCTLRDGIINVDGRDYLFGKAQCEFEW